MKKDIDVREQEQEFRNLVPLVGSYFMGADAKQYVLVEKVTSTNRKTGNTYESLRTVGYYTSLSQVVEGLIKSKTREGIQSGEIATLRHYVDEVRGLTDALRKLLA